MVPVRLFQVIVVAVSRLWLLVLLAAALGVAVAAPMAVSVAPVTVTMLTVQHHPKSKAIELLFEVLALTLN